MSGIDNTWIAYALDTHLEPAKIERGVSRVGAHYSKQYSDQLEMNRAGNATAGMVLWSRRNPHLSWPLWCADSELSVATTHPPVGSTASAGNSSDLASNALALGRDVLEHEAAPDTLAPPFLISAWAPRTSRLVIANDFLSAGRLYEMRTADGCFWSNRVGALPLLTGEAPRADEHAWAVHAATGWFLGELTPVEGIRKVAPGTAIVIDAKPGGAEIGLRDTQSLRRIVEPRSRSLGDGLDEAAAGVRSYCHSLGASWDSQIKLNLSGGRDSRVVAAAAVAAGLAVKVSTKDIEPGESELVESLLGRLDPAPKLKVVALEQGTPSEDLGERIMTAHLIHDGLANPMSAVTGNSGLPQSGFSKPLLTGHGGELGHGFYYSDKPLRAVKKLDSQGLVDRLERSGRQKHDAARPAAYKAYVEEIKATLDEGREFGIEGPTLLDYFYLVHRLPFRAGIGSRNDRYSACLAPEFLRACFDMTPRERIKSRLHTGLIERLVPAWKGVEYFASGSGPMKKVKRDRIWDKPLHSAQMEEILESDGWTSAFDESAVREMWRTAKIGEGHSSFESVFMRVAWRSVFDRYLEDLSAEIGIS